MGLGSLEQLVTLYLEENLLEGLDDFSLRTLSSLEELYVNHNRLNSISQHAFSGLTSLLRFLLHPSTPPLQHLPLIYTTSPSHPLIYTTSPSHPFNLH